MFRQMTIDKLSEALDVLAEHIATHGAAVAVAAGSRVDNARLAVCEAAHKMGLPTRKRSLVVYTVSRRHELRMNNDGFLTHTCRARTPAEQ
jgi:hypothetical protein